MSLRTNERAVMDYVVAAVKTAISGVTVYVQEMQEERAAPFAVVACTGRTRLERAESVTKEAYLLSFEIGVVTAVSAGVQTYQTMTENIEALRVALNASKNPGSVSYLPQVLDIQTPVMDPGDSRIMMQFRWQCVTSVDR